ncbi:hemolysin family protein [Dermabacteraceae bacterium P13115]
MNTSDIALLVLALSTLMVTVALAAVDAAMLSVSRASLIRALEDQNERRRRAVLRHYEDANQTFAAINLARVFCQTAYAVAITALLFSRLDGLWLPLLLSFAVTAVLSFLLASVSPRTIGRRYPDETVIRLSGLVTLLRVVLGPLATLLIHVGSSFTPGGKVTGGPYASEAELRHFVDRATEHQELENDERDMIHGVFDLGDTKIRELMVPRTDMVTISDEATLGQAIRLFVRSGFSRVPVIGESVDDTLGMLYVKDVMRALHAPGARGEDRPVTDVMRPVTFVPEFMHADRVMRDMQTARVHVAIVVDEYGGVSGIVTIEDILEEIVGEIADEHDRATQEIEDLGDGTIRVPARASISEVGEHFGLDIEDDDVDTVAGLLAKALGRVPIPGSQAVALDLEMTAERTSGRRKKLATVLVRRAENAPGEGEN